jgi:hypothetical protein
MAALRVAPKEDNARFYIRNGVPFVMGTSGGDREQLLQDTRTGGVYAIVSPQMGKQVCAPMLVRAWGCLALTCFVLRHAPAGCMPSPQTGERVCAEGLHTANTLCAGACTRVTQARISIH